MENTPKKKGIFGSGSFFPLPEPEMTAQTPRQELKEDVSQESELTQLKNQGGSFVEQPF